AESAKRSHRDQIRVNKLTTPHRGTRLLKTQSPLRRYLARQRRLGRPVPHPSPEGAAPVRQHHVAIVAMRPRFVGRLLQRPTGRYLRDLPVVDGQNSDVDRGTIWWLASGRSYGSARARAPCERRRTQRRPAKRLLVHRPTIARALHRHHPSRRPVLARTAETPSAAQSEQSLD